MAKWMCILDGPVTEATGPSDDVPKRFQVRIAKCHKFIAGPFNFIE